MGVDQELRALAETSADRYPDSLLSAQGWTRAELVDAIHQRLLNKYADMRASGELVADGDVIRHAREPRKSRRRRSREERRHRYPADTHPAPPTACPTPTKLAFHDQDHAQQTLRYWNYGNAAYRPERAYPCPCGSWHLSSKPQRKDPS